MRFVGNEMGQTQENRDSSVWATVSPSGAWGSQEEPCQLPFSSGQQADPFDHTTEASDVHRGQSEPRLSRERRCHGYHATPRAQPVLLPPNRISSSWPCWCRPWPSRGGHGQDQAAVSSFRHRSALV